jgi:hypothetical protein
LKTRGLQRWLFEGFSGPMKGFLNEICKDISEAKRGKLSVG